MRPVPLTTINGGINRLRTKGGARADSLYDLLNAQVTDSGTIQVRPGSRRDAQVNTATKGICSFGDSLHVFCHEVVDVPSNLTLHVLPHPTDSALTISQIHFSEPFLGFLYVVAEFEDESIFHYWLRSSGAWVADTVYFVGDLVEPTDPNGLAYAANRIGSPFPVWVPNVGRANDDIVEPTTYNGFYFTVVDTVGTNPRSGTTEPDWPAAEGAQVVEDVDGVLSTQATPATAPSTDTTPQTTQDRYGIPSNSQAQP